jgi:hypothetical protein
LATEACQAQTEDAYDGHLVLRRLAGLVLLYTARVVLKGQVTTEEVLFGALPWNLRSQAACMRAGIMKRKNQNEFLV